MAVWGDFKKFAFKGNVVDLAVGVIIGGSFGKIVTSLVENLIMPVASLALPAGNWRDNGFILRHGATPKDDIVFRWGAFLGTVLDFFVVAWVLFFFVSKIVKAAELRLGIGADPPTIKNCPFCLETVPIKATRCKACTSDLREPELTTAA